MKKIIGAFLLLSLIGYFIYFVSGVSATLPHIREYECQGNLTQVVTNIKKLTSTQSHLILNIGPVLGNKSNGYAYDITLQSDENSHPLLYELKLETTDNVQLTKLSIIGAHDLTNDTGGYGIKAAGMEILLHKFDNQIIPSLKSNGIKMKLL